MKKSIFILIMMTVVGMASLNAQNQVNLRVSNVENSKGELYIALFSPEDLFLKKSSHSRIVKVEGDIVEITFSELAKEQYAIVVFHDENSNGKLDLGNYGIPLEKYGFSNDVNPGELKRVPTFEECMFEVNDETNVSISLTSVLPK